MNSESIPQITFTNILCRSVEALKFTGWPLNRENRENRESAGNFIYPGKTGKNREFRFKNREFVTALVYQVYFQPPDFFCVFFLTYRGLTYIVAPMCMENTVCFIVIWYELIVLLIRTGAKLTFAETGTRYSVRLYFQQAVGCGSGGFNGGWNGRSTLRPVFVQAICIIFWELVIPPPPLTISTYQPHITSTLAFYVSVWMVFTIIPGRTITIKTLRKTCFLC